MFKKLRAGLSAVAVLAVTPAVLWAAGNWSTLPIVGSPAVCVSNVSGTGGPTAPYLIVPANTQGTTQGICGQTMPAGPIALTGSELIPADTGLSGGQPPQTVVIPSGLLGSATNRLIGGDFDTNLAQRLNSTKGVSALAATTPTAAIITADRWWVVAPVATVTTTIDSTVSSSTVAALNNTKALRIARTSGDAGGVVCVGQTLDTQAAAPLLGNNAVFSFWEKNGSTMSATNGQIVVNIDYTTVADGAGTQATLGYAGVNGSLFAQLDTGGTITGLTNATQGVTGLSPGTTGTVIAGLTSGYAAQIPASTTWTRYSVYANIPTTLTSSATPVTEVNVSICFTPAAATSVATDYIEIEGLQLEAASSAVTANLPAGIVSPKAFQRRDAATEHNLEYYYWYFNYENQALVTGVSGTSCLDVTTSLLACTLSFPVQMRIVPSVKFTDGFQAFSSTAYTTAQALTSLAVYTQTITSVPSASEIMFKGVCGSGGCPAAGTANFLFSLGTSSSTGIISASAEP